jgi:alpha-L-fucosidase
MTPLIPAFPKMTVSVSFRSMSIRSLILLLAVPTLGWAEIHAAPRVPAPKPFGTLPNESQLRHAEMEMYAFIHLTINTFTGKEWGYGDEDPALFNPTAPDIGQIAETLQKAGMQGIILTAKHHDGFCLWPTKTTSHNISHSPYRDGKGDLVAEISSAARERGMKFGVYLSPWDRNNPKYGKAEYVTQVFRPQLEELLTNYGEVFEVWFDGANGGDGYYGGARERRSIDRLTYYGWAETWKGARKIQPQAVLFSDAGPDLRWIGNEAGFAADPCWATYTPVSPDGDEAKAGPGNTRYRDGERGTRHGRDWMPGEVDVSIRHGWFWHEHENGHVKSPQHLWNIYLQSVGRGAHFLLNVPPDRRGIIHERDVSSLTRFGDLLRETFARNLAAGASLKASHIRGGDPAWGPDRMIDSDKWSAWTTDDEVREASVEITLPGAKTFNLVRLREDIRLGQRIDDVALDVMADGNWKEVARAQTVGYCRLWEIPTVTTDRVRLRVVKSSACPALSDFGLFLRPAIPPLDGAVVKLRPQDRNGWSVTASAVATGNSASAAIDGDPATFWHTHDESKGESGLPQDLTLDLGKVKAIKGFTALPRQDGIAHGMVDRYRAETSTDGKTWTLVAEGEFSNIRANPIEQVVSFVSPVSARYLRIQAVRALEKRHASFAEIGVLE